ncbi:polygalacturonase inhibitor-like [Iris pallida]|uniref:Polygalacturonase inhibitor-like n=1 Tax=Iris pallida TaxID=29817 RepID=A0AAX6IGM8_IRIPA|nr:polygalacturonase inhibitor-like [Iris pallida]
MVGCFRRLLLVGQYHRLQRRPRHLSHFHERRVQRRGRPRPPRHPTAVPRRPLRSHEHRHLPAAEPPRPYPLQLVQAEEPRDRLHLQHQRLRPRPFVPLPAHFPPRTPSRLLQPLGSPPSFSGRPRQPQQSLVYTQQAHGDHPVDPLQQARQRHTARRPQPGREPADGRHPQVLRPGPVPIHQSAGQPAQRRRFVPLRQVQTLLGSSDLGEEQTVLRSHQRGIPSKERAVHRPRQQRDLREHQRADHTSRTGDPS